MPSVAFNEWYNEHYKTPFDFNSDKPDVFVKRIMDFYHECKNNNIKPIVGLEITVDSKK